MDFWHLRQRAVPRIVQATQQPAHPPAAAPLAMAAPPAPNHPAVQPAPPPVTLAASPAHLAEPLATGVTPAVSAAPLSMAALPVNDELDLVDIDEPAECMKFSLFLPTTLLTESQSLVLHVRHALRIPQHTNPMPQLLDWGPPSSKCRQLTQARATK